MVDITVAKPFYSVLILAFGCSLLVAGAAVGLKPLQDANRQLDRQKNILYAAGLYLGAKPALSPRERPGPLPGECPHPGSLYKY